MLANKLGSPSSNNSGCDWATQSVYPDITWNMYDVSYKCPQIVK